jgi:hypothetical protein
VRVTCSTWNYARGNTNRNRICRYILQYNCVSTNSYVVSDSNRTEYFRTSTNIHSISDHRGAPDPSPPQPDSYTVPDHYVVTQDRIATDYDPAEVVNSKPLTNIRFTGKLDPSKYLNDFEHELIDERKWRSNDSPSDTIAPSAKPIHGHDPQTLAPDIALMANPVFSDILKHRKLPGFEPRVLRIQPAAFEVSAISRLPPRVAE